MKNTVTSFDIHRNTYTVPVDQLTWRPAAYGIIIQNDAILLTKQHKTLQLPGGGVNFGEMPEDAVIREVQEETGFIVAHPKLVGCISGFFTLKRTGATELSHVQSILLYYVCELTGGTASIAGFENDEKLIGDMPEWVPLNKLDEIAAGSTINWREIVTTYLKTK